MPRYRFEFERDVTIVERVFRVIEADSAERAQEMASAIASDFNSDCPDDAAEVDGCATFGDWEPDRFHQTEDAADYRDDAVGARA